MKSTSLGVAVVLALAAIDPARPEEKPPEPATWEEAISKGIVPYRQLTVADFPINEKAYPKHGFYVKTAIIPRYHFMLKPYNGFAYAFIDQWLVFAGLDKNETSRKSRVKNMKAELPYAQALLDLTEIYARQIATLKPGELPEGRGNSFEEAQADLTSKLNIFMDAKYKISDAESEAFMKATGHGENKKKVRELGTEIKKRLEATPATTVPYTEPSSQLKATSSAVTNPSTPSPTPAAR